MALTLTVDLREQTTARGRAIQQADCDRIAGVLHYVAAHQLHSGAAPYLAEARRRLDAAADAYQTHGLGVEWIRTGRWASEVKQAEATCVRGGFAYSWVRMEAVA